MSTRSDCEQSQLCQLLNSLYNRPLLAIALDLGPPSLTTVDLHIYAPRATKKFETIKVEIKSGKISVESLLKEYPGRDSIFGAQNLIAIR